MTSIISELVWDNDVTGLKTLLEKIRRKDPETDFLPSIDEWDNRGNPPLHLALMLGRKEVIKLLLKYGASVSTVNGKNWDAVDEAICLGDRKILGDILQRYVHEEIEILTARDGPWQKVNTVLPEFHAELELKLRSPVPAVGSACPKEKIKIWKTRNELRVDWSISKVLGFKIARAPMSFVAKIKDDGTVEAFAVNRDEKVIEKLYPVVSKSIIHDLVDACLRDGIVRDEIPLLTFKVQRAATTFKTAKSRHIRSINAQTEVYHLNNLTCAQHFRVPVIVPQLYDQCSDNCRSVPVKEHIKHTKDLEKTQKIESLNALQYISESDLALEIGTKAEDVELAEASYAFKNVIPSGPADVEKIDNAIKDYMQKVGRAASKHMRSISRSSTIFRHSRSHTRSSTGASVKFPDNPVDLSKLTIKELEYVRMHIKDFPVAEIAVTKEEYVASDRRLHLSRECNYSTANYVRNKPVILYMAKDFKQLSLYDILPLVEWMTRRSIQPGELQRFVDENFATTGFPVRIEIPIFAMLSAKLTLKKFERNVKEKKEDLFAAPADYEEKEIFPLVEFDYCTE